MQFVFEICAVLVGLPLQLLVIAAMLRGAWRRYPFVFLYVIVDFLTTALELRPSLAFDTASPEQKDIFRRLYWWDERIIQAMVFLMVISLVYKATKSWRPRRTLLLGTIFGTLTFAAITFFIHYGPGMESGKWMTPWTRDLNFCAAILDLGLWAALIGARDKNYQLLMVSGALGIQFTGGAIGQALRGMTNGSWIVADFITLMNLTCLYIWWQAFRAVPQKPNRKDQLPPQPGASAVHHSSPK